jgi:hypothetical protein
LVIHYSLTAVAYASSNVYTVFGYQFGWKLGVSSRETSTISKKKVWEISEKTKSLGWVLLCTWLLIYSCHSPGKGYTFLSREVQSSSKIPSHSHQESKRTSFKTQILFSCYTSLNSQNKYMISLCSLQDKVNPHCL